jgi:hypothetical protein
VISETSLLEAAQRLADAQRQGDVGALQQVIAADYSGHDPAGRVQDRPGVLGAYGDGHVRVTALERSDVSARVIGETGLVTGVSAFQGKQGDGVFDFRVRFLEVYVWREGRWQLVASQDTLLPG